MDRPDLRSWSLWISEITDSGGLDLEHHPCVKPAPTRTKANTSVSAPLELCLCLPSFTRCSQSGCTSPSRRVLSSTCMISCKYKLPYALALMPIFMPLILTRLPIKAIGMLNMGLNNSLRGRAIWNDHPSLQKQHFLLIAASSHCAENEWCFIYRQDTKLKAQDESCQLQRQK